MSGTEPEPVGLLQVESMYEWPSANRVICHARCVSVGRSVFPGDLVLAVDSQPGSGVSPARVVRIHRPPFGEFSELPPVWHAAVELEGPAGAAVFWVRPDANLRVVLPAAGGEEGQTG